MTEGPWVQASTASLCSVLEQDINPSLVLVQPRKTHPYITERLLMGRKKSKQTKHKQTNQKLVWSAFGYMLQMS